MINTGIWRLWIKQITLRNEGEPPLIIWGHDDPRQSSERGVCLQTATQKLRLSLRPSDSRSLPQLLPQTPACRPVLQISDFLAPGLRESIPRNQAMSRYRSYWFCLSGGNSNMAPNPNFWLTVSIAFLLLFCFHFNWYTLVRMAEEKKKLRTSVTTFWAEDEIIAY